MMSIVRWDSEESYTEYLKRLAEAAGLETGDDDTVACDAAGRLVVDVDPDSPFIDAAESDNAE
jgi:hypothetical protein